MYWWSYQVQNTLTGFHPLAPQKKPLVAHRASAAHGPFTLFQHRHTRSIRSSFLPDSSHIQPPFLKTSPIFTSFIPLPIRVTTRSAFWTLCGTGHGVYPLFFSVWTRVDLDFTGTGTRYKEELTRRKKWPEGEKRKKTSKQERSDKGAEIESFPTGVSAQCVGGRKAGRIGSGEHGAGWTDC